jgi:uncharacterized membrane protein
VEPFSAIRATTVHPALVHVTLGVLPVVVLAYGLAAARRSDRWSFAGDVALGVGAVFTIATAGAGLVANALVPWPEGLETWRWLHLGLGAAGTVLLLALAAVRFRALRRGALAGRGTAACALLLAFLFGATGWIGGEVLVFHSGMAVTAAAHGALAPTLSRRSTPPEDLDDAMERLRGAWADASAAYGRMLVERPSADGYARVAGAAGEIARVARWLEAEGPRRVAEHAGEHAGPEVAATVEQLAGLLGEGAAQLEAAASAQRWSGVTRSLGAVTSACAGCHEAARWSGEHAH